MLLNYLKIAFRNLLRNRFFSFVNILGLSVGIVSTIMVILFVKEELAYDKHHSRHEHIYRVISNFHVNNKQDLFALSAAPLAPTLADEYPFIESYVRFIPLDNFFFRLNGKDYNEQDIFFADSTAFNVFDYKIVLGETNPLAKPYSIVLTKTLSNQLFGAENPIGKVLTGKENEPFVVTAVIEDLPRSSHLNFNALVSTTTIRQQIGEDQFNDRSSGSFWNVNSYSYVLFSPNTDPTQVINNFDFFNEKYLKPVGDIINGTFIPIFQPLAQTHFPKIQSIQADFPTGNRSNVYIFSFVALFILIIACINYMNMATARSAKKSKDVGIRKVVGASKHHIVFQNISEAVFIALIASTIAYIFSFAVLPWFNSVADKNISAYELLKPSIILGVLCISIVVGIVSGSYPAFYLSSFSPISILRSTISKGRSKVGLRKFLVVFQFAISLIMITATIVVSQQQRFIRTKDLGFNEENLLVLTDVDTLIGNRFETFKQELLSNHSIIAVAGSQDVLGIGNGKIVSRIEQQGEMMEVGINLIGCDFEYLKLLGVELEEGRYFNSLLRTDSTQAFIINKEAEKVYGWTNNALDKRIQLGIRMDGSASRDGRVVGVVNNFHYSSIHNPIEPFMFYISTAPPRNVSIRFKPEESKQVLDFVKTKFQDYNVKRDFSYYYLDEKLESLYRSEQKLGWLFRVFSMVTIFISCLGLLGLSSYVTEQRTKEIGIRKVMGASTTSILNLLNRQFFSLVLIANVFAIPIAYYAMLKWLEGFAYRIDFGSTIFSTTTILPFVIAAILAILMAFLTVITVSWRAAESDPAYSLKYE